MNQLSYVVNSRYTRDATAPDLWVSIAYVDPQSHCLATDEKYATYAACICVRDYSTWAQKKVCATCILHTYVHFFFLGYCTCFAPMHQVFR